MRGRGGRPRSNEEMLGSKKQEQIFERFNFGMASSDKDLAAAGACRARYLLRDSSTVVLCNVFAAFPGRVVHFHHRCVAGAAPPNLGSFNPYGGEGPKTLTADKARRAAATTPPLLGCMNPYGGEGPPSQHSASASA